MNYKIIIITFLFLFSTGCEQKILKNRVLIDTSIEHKYRNAGFALIYDDSLNNIKKLEPRSLKIYHKTLKKKSVVKIINLINDKYLIAEVTSNREKFSDFYNSVLSTRIAETLEIDKHEPYVKIILVSKNSTFVAKQAKTFDEEKNVAQKAPIDGIQINDLNYKPDNKKKENRDVFSYSIKIADFYYKDTAKMMVSRIKSETNINNSKIIKLSQTKYRVLLGPFDDIKKMKEIFEKIKILNFENLEILRNV